LHEALERAEESYSGRHAVLIAEITVTYKKRVCVFSREDQLLTNTTLALRNPKDHEAEIPDKPEEREKLQNLYRPGGAAHTI